MKIALCSILVLALSLPARAQLIESRPGERLDEETGTLIRAATSDDGKATKAVTCTLTFSPAIVTNGQVTNYLVSYGGTTCVNGQISEAVYIHWPSIVAGFGEFTERRKMLTISAGCLAGSSEAVVAPSALGIKGNVTAQLVVRDWTGVFICSATGTLTVI